MLVMRSDKYNYPRFCRGLVEANTIDGKRYFVDIAKYVQVDSDLVFIINGTTKRIEPTYATIKKRNKIDIDHELEILMSKACALDM